MNVASHFYLTILEKRKCQTLDFVSGRMDETCALLFTYSSAYVGVSR